GAVLERRLEVAIRLRVRPPPRGPPRRRDEGASRVLFEAGAQRELEAELDVLRLAALESLDVADVRERVDANLVIVQALPELRRPGRRRTAAPARTGRRPPGRRRARSHSRLPKARTAGPRRRRPRPPRGARRARGRSCPEIPGRRARGGEGRACGRETATP